MPFLPPASTNPQHDRMTNAEKKRFHEQHGGKFDLSSGLKGAAGGAMAGGMAGGPWGALGGAGLGFFAGGRAGAAQNKAQQIEEEAMADAIGRQDVLRREMEQRRARDLEATMGFYGPAQAALGNLYGIPASAWGPGMPGNRPPGPGPAAGPAAGMTAAPMRPDLRSLFERQPLSGLPAGTRLSSNLPRKSYSSLFQRRG
jgi:hypothetical protein